MIVIDSDIFVLDVLYPTDERTEINKAFIARKELDRATTIFNVLEVCGIISFNKSRDDLNTIYHRFHEEYNLRILYPMIETSPSRYDLRNFVARVFSKISQKMTFGDAAVLTTAESARAEMLITWNTGHFEGRTNLMVITPETFLNR